MSTINGYDAGSINTLLGSLGTGTSGTGAASGAGLYGINVMDYNSIRNGSYGKLMKSYYAIEEGEDKKTNSKNDTDDTDNTLRSIRDAAADLKESAQAVYGSKSLFEADADGKLDMEAVYEKVNEFVESYNATVKAVGSAETDGIARAGASMVNGVAENVDMLKKLGITISGSDFTLSIDKEKFLASRASDVKSMFSGVGSFAYQIGAKASRIHSMVADKVSATGSFHSAAGSNATNSTSKDTAGKIAKVKDMANTLNAVGSDLYNNKDLFKLDSEGKYDREKIKDEISDFIESYNDLLISAEGSKSSTLKNAVAAMKDITEGYGARLAKLGIGIDDSDGTLVFNEETFDSAEMYRAENIFSGNASYAYKISVKAAMIANQAENEANKSNTYTGTGAYSDNHNTGSILDGLV